MDKFLSEDKKMFSSAVFIDSDIDERSLDDNSYKQGSTYSYMTYIIEILRRTPPENRKINESHAQKKNELDRVMLEHMENNELPRNGWTLNAIVNCINSLTGTNEEKPACLKRILSRKKECFITLEELKNSLRQMPEEFTDKLIKELDNSTSEGYIFGSLKNHFRTRKEIKDELNKLLHEYGFKDECKELCSKTFRRYMDALEKDPYFKNFICIFQPRGSCTKYYANAEMLLSEEIQYLCDSLIFDENIDIETASLLIKKLGLKGNGMRSFNAALPSIKKFHTTNKNVMHNIQIINMAIENNKFITFKMVRYKLKKREVYLSFEEQDSDQAELRTFLCKPLMLTKSNNKYYVICAEERWSNKFVDQMSNPILEKYCIKDLKEICIADPKDDDVISRDNINKLCHDFKDFIINNRHNESFTGGAYSSVHEKIMLSNDGNEEYITLPNFKEKVVYDKNGGFHFFYRDTVDLKIQITANEQMALKLTERYGMSLKFSQAGNIECIPLYKTEVLDNPLNLAKWVISLNMDKNLMQDLMKGFKVKSEDERVMIYQDGKPHFKNQDKFYIYLKNHIDTFSKLLKDHEESTVKE